VATSTPSLWEYPHPSRSAAPLAGNVRYDVAVVGGGIAGLTTAYLLAREGKKVVVLEWKPAVAAGETEYTTAHLAWYIDDEFTHLASVRGDEAAKLAAASHRAAVDLIGEIARQEGIDCDYRPVDAYLFAGTQDGPETIRREEDTLRRLGLPFERADAVPFPAKGDVPTLKFPAHARVHPLKYLAEVAGAIRKYGGVIHTGTPVAKVRGGSPCEVETKAGNVVTAGAVVIATNNPFEAGTVLHNKVGAYTTYAFAAEIPKGTVPDALYWDTDEPYHYVRLQPGDAGDRFDYLIVGGDDHKTGQADDQDERWGRLERWAKERFPQLGAVRRRWSGQVFETPDGLGFIGLAPWNGDHVYLITGDSGMGMTHGTIGARLVADLIQQKPQSDLAGLFSPSRWVPAAARTLFEENLNIVAQYTDWLTGGEVKGADEIPPGHGAVVRSGLTKLALYKDDRGQVTRLSAVCPHMGCIVRWNPGEKTWDCPCHGSRYTATGEVLHGPTTTALPPAE
jgi:glycine/D-amino acid oxidase-like deaminating enzyme/nitrite reductase/ring-hydroxylating ferredoxin subunit